MAATLEVSPSTLIKLMQRFGLPRPTDLSLETIEAALERAGGDVAEAARTQSLAAGAEKASDGAELEAQEAVSVVAAGRRV